MTTGEGTRVRYQFATSAIFLTPIQEEEAHFMRLVSILHELLVCEVKNPEKQDTLIR